MTFSKRPLLKTRQGPGRGSGAAAPRPGLSLFKSKVSVNGFSLVESLVLLVYTGVYERSLYA